MNAIEQAREQLAWRYVDFMNHIMGVPGKGEDYSIGDASYPLGIEQGMRHLQTPEFTYESQLKDLAVRLGEAYERILGAKLADRDRSLVLDALAETKSAASAAAMLSTMDVIFPIGTAALPRAIKGA
ncbi:MAG: hypothetical protein ABI432_08665 [Flavobacteriales bacterium]